MGFITPALIKGLLVAIIIGGLLYGINRYQKYHQSIGYDRRTAEYVIQENHALKAVIAETERLKLLVEEATNERKKLEDKNTVLIARNNTLLGKLRDTDTHINTLLPSASTEALQSAVRAYRELFAECREAYAEMGRAAAGHLADVKQLEAAP